jgi:hypothetical protein
MRVFYRINRILKTKRKYRVYKRFADLLMNPPDRGVPSPSNPFIRGHPILFACARDYITFNRGVEKGRGFATTPPMDKNEIRQAKGGGSLLAPPFDTMTQWISGNHAMYSLKGLYFKEWVHHCDGKKIEDNRVKGSAKKKSGLNIFLRAGYRLVLIEGFIRNSSEKYIKLILRELNPSS